MTQRFLRCTPRGHRPVGNAALLLLLLSSACGGVKPGGRDGAMAADGRVDVVNADAPRSDAADAASTDGGAADGARADGSADADTQGDAGDVAAGTDGRDALLDGPDVLPGLDVLPDGANTVCTQAPVVLGAAGNFLVLAGSTVTSTGATTVTGDLGVSPGTAVTGFPPGILIGAQHAGDPAAALGMAALTVAYNAAAGRTLCPVTTAGNLGGMTLAPGLYKSTSSLEISSGDLTLDAGGNGNAVFIFQVASTLTTTPGRKVLLIGGAKASNVFWQVGTSASLGTTSVFAGTVMADQAITLGTGASLNGRLLARVAAVSLDSNVIVAPTP